MSEEEMETDLRDAQSYLSATRLTADRSRHSSTTETALWIFDSAPDTKKITRRQIGCIKRIHPVPVTDQYRWEVTRMSHGMPCARRAYRTLLDCIGDLMRFEPQT